jgi:hypothetical protein
MIFLTPTEIGLAAERLRDYRRVGRTIPLSPSSAFEFLHSQDPRRTTAALGSDRPISIATPAPRRQERPCAIVIEVREGAMKRILRLGLCAFAFAGMASADPAQIDPKQPGQATVWVIAMTLLGSPGVPMKDIPEFTTQSGCELYLFHIGEQVVGTFKLVCLSKETD